MNDANRDICTLPEDYFDGELGAAEALAFEGHLVKCPNCRRRLRELERLRKAMRQAFNQELGEDADLRIRRRLKRQEEETGPSGEVMDLEDVARLLKIPVPEVIDLLGQLPSFEIGGRLRFRRDRIMAWIKDSERRLLRDRQESALHQARKIIQFTGGV